MYSQGVNSKTFRLPTSPSILDAETPLPALWDWHMENSPEHPIFVYEDKPGILRTLCWKECNRAIHRSARFIQSCASQHAIANEDPHKPVVVGILGVLNTLSYWALLTGIMRAGFHAFVISPRNSSAGVAHLLQATHCKMLFVSDDSNTQELYLNAMKQVDHDIVTIDAPRHEGFFTEESSFEPLPPYEIPSMDVFTITMHSSGSTSFPKPIPLTHRMFVRMSVSKHYQSDDGCGNILSTHGIPLFHAMGVFWTIGYPTTCGGVCGILRPQHPPIIPSPNVMLEQAVATRCNQMLIVPSILEDWSQSPDALAKLKTFDAVFWGGGPLGTVSGDLLVKEGVRIRIGYGATEVGAPAQFALDDMGMDWMYFKESKQMTIYWKPHGDNLFEPVVLSTPTYAPAVCNTTVDGVPGYALNDLCAPHPTKKGYWMIYGRVDDQIMHSTGEKTNPGPLETIISNHPSIQACVMFGRGKVQAGILVEPIEEKRFDLNDLEKVAAFRNEIWPQIEKANAFAPQHSRLFKEMIVVSNLAKPFTFTGKGTVKRQAMINLYGEEIEAAYAAAESPTKHDIPIPSTWTSEESVDFIRKLVGKLIPRNVADDADLFQSGADSLQATYLRVSIVQAFRDTKQDTSGLSQDLVYAHPTIASLGNFISNLASGILNGHTNGTRTTIVEDMQNMVEEYTRAFPKHAPTKPAPEYEAVLVTGTTGSLGTYLLAKLISTPSIHRVYALNRSGKQTGKFTLLERQTEAFKTHGIDLSVIGSPKLVLLEGDTSLPDFGLSKEQVKEMVDSLTSIIHNAWRVDFNVPLSSFKPLVAGVRNLVDLALASPFPDPPSIVFTSSVGVVSGWKQPSLVPEGPLEDPNIAVAAGGYSQSKWISERILDVANKTTDTRNVIVRVGQLCGSRIKGSWNPWEWFPAIVQSHKLVHCLPDAAGLITWIPVDIAAAATVDMRKSPASYLHLMHPRPVTWRSIIKPIADSLDVPVVPYSEWLQKLNISVKEHEESSTTADQLEAAREHPALRLIDFYRRSSTVDQPESQENTEAEAFVNVRLDMTVTKKAIATLGDPDLSTLGVEDAHRWLAYWREAGVL